MDRTQVLHEVGDLEPVDRHVIRVEVAGADHALLQRDVRQGCHAPAMAGQLEALAKWRPPMVSITTSTPPSPMISHLPENVLPHMVDPLAGAVV